MPKKPMSFTKIIADRLEQMDQLRQATLETLQQQVQQGQRMLQALAQQKEALESEDGGTDETAYAEILVTETEIRKAVAFAESLLASEQGETHE